MRATSPDPTPLKILPLAIACAVALLLSGSTGAEEKSCWPGEPGSDPALCPPDDPRFKRRWDFLSRIPDEVDATKMHPRERELGSIGASVDTAWQLTVGSDEVVIAVLDSGIRWGARDLTNKLYLNAGELPLPQTGVVHDANGDGVFDVRDYAGDERVGDKNGNGRLDPQDLILAFSDCTDDDGNGYADDISGYDLFAGSHCGLERGDNDPEDATDFGHGTGIASTAAAETNNGIGDAGVCPRCRILPVRVGDSFVVDANQFARGVVFAVDGGASVIASALGSYNNTPAARAAIDYAYSKGVPVIASAADEFSYHHNYPSVNNHALYVNAIRYNHATDFTKATTFWGVNPCTNFGARVWVTVPARSCSSGATSRLAGMVGLVQSMALEAGSGRLHAEEVYQLLRMTADDLDNSDPDWGRARYPAKQGYDQLYGYGRVNARRAVTAVREGRIPPIVDLHDPRWFAVVSPRVHPRLPIRGVVRAPRAERVSYRLEYALGVEPAESDYRLVAERRNTGATLGVLGELDFGKLPLPAGPAPRNREQRDRYSVTIRLTATDDRGLRSEARRSFFVFDDSAWLEHFPFDVGASGEAAPLVRDLDGDGRDEIVLASAAGVLWRLDWESDGLRALPIPLNRSFPIAGSRRTDGREAARPWDSVVRGVVAGDLDGSGRTRLVVATRAGRVYVFDPEGRRLSGFPVATARNVERSASPSQPIESGVLSRPRLADVDGKPGAEILVSSLDGHVYVWRHDGKLLDGFPVALAVERPEGSLLAKSVSSPAVGDVDGDGSPDLVVGANAVADGLPAVFAVRAKGNRDPRGPFVPGWHPFELAALRTTLFPTLAAGVHVDPVLFDVDGDGDDEAIVYTATGSSVVVVGHDAEAGARALAKLSMRPGARAAMRDTAFVGGTGSPLLADTDADGRPEFYAPMLPLRMLTLRSKPGVPLEAPPALGGWELTGLPDDGKRIPMLPNYPRRMEDLMVFAAPTAADVDGDGTDEVLMGSGGYLLHAFRGVGGEAPGFPKFTGGWIFSAPAIGDIDGDGSPDVVTVTREGYLFAWSTSSEGEAGSGSESSTTK
ncbi:MAG: S8 family serine peptidase [bacterium]|nr:S8 family serine peptidase [bacterium]